MGSPRLLECLPDEALLHVIDLLDMRHQESLARTSRQAHRLVRSAQPHFEPGLESWESLCKSAARRGDLRLLQWARAHGAPPWNSTVILSCALTALHLPTLQWVQEVEPNARALVHAGTWVRAARMGRLDVLQWMRAQSPLCRWNAAMCRAAAENGHLHVLQWARAQRPPCPWDESTCMMAAANGHLHVLQWARAQRPPCPWDAATAYARAEEAGHLEVMQWIRAQGAPA